MPSHTLALDFGTSNSAAAILDGGDVRRLPIEDGADTLPTAVFFPANGGDMRIGADATAALINGDDGRFMRALKSVLGSSLLHEERPIGGKRRALSEIISAFLAEVKHRAEATSGLRFSDVLSGRPVHFHSADAARDQQAEVDLRGCYLNAGFDDVTFVFEPEAAALASHRLSDDGAIGMIVDIGGGTSDFTAFRADGGRADILASYGIRLGGTDFDQLLSLRHAMPLLGLDTMLRREFGPGEQPAPRGIYADLATWAKIPFLYTRDTRRSVATMAQLAVDHAAFERLETVLELELGHQLAFATETGKIAANAGDATSAIEMGYIEKDLFAPIGTAALQDTLAHFKAELGEAATETIKRACILPAEVSTIILVGGSSLMSIVSDEMQTVCPNAGIKRTDAFTAVVDGLALATAAK